MNENEFFIRGATPHDDAAAIAKYLFLTDDLIYPSLCLSFTDKGWIEFIRANLRNRRHIFCSDNLSVAEQNGQIVAVCCYFCCGKPFAFLENVPSEMRENYTFVDENYFRPLCEETMQLSGIYIVNLCVEANCRGRGIGTALLTDTIKRFSEQNIFLDVLEDNRSAISLYGSLGFQTIKKHFGFGGKRGQDVSCLQMMRPKEAL